MNGMENITLNNPGLGQSGSDQPVITQQILKLATETLKTGVKHV